MLMLTSYFLQLMTHCVNNLLQTNRDACIKFKELWKRKHESGQWLEIEAAEALSSRADFSPSMNASGIILTSMTDKQTESREALSESQSEPSPTNKGNASAGVIWKHWESDKIWLNYVF